jgi:alpha-1,2-mannosyltransferase
MSPATAGDRVGDRDLTTWRTAPGRALARSALATARWARPHGVGLITLAVGLVLCGLFTLGAAQVYDEVTDEDGLAALDQPVLRAAVRSRTSAVTRVVQAYTDLGGPVGMPLLATAVLALLAWRALDSDRLGCLLVVQLFGLLISPISWTHHWVWLVPLMIWLLHGPWRNRLGARVLGYGWLALTLVGVPWLLSFAQPTIWQIGRPWYLAWAGLVYIVATLATLAWIAARPRREPR